MRKTVIVMIGLMLCQYVMAQSYKNDKFYRYGPNACPETINANIPGTPKLSKPVLIMGETMPVIGKGHGLGAPAFYDWDKDGKKDLLIGEFGSGIENGYTVGSFMRVYKNVGDISNPKFKGRFQYAYPSRKCFSNGTPLSAKHG